MNACHVYCSICDLLSHPHCSHCHSSYLLSEKAKSSCYLARKQDAFSSEQRSESATAKAASSIAAGNTSTSAATVDYSHTS